MHDVRDRGRRDQHPEDDWLGAISDDDWDEGAAEQRATPVPQQRRTPEAGTESSRVVGASAQTGPVAATDAHRAGVERRRIVAAFIVVLLVALGATAAVVLLRDEAGDPVATESDSADVTTPAPTDTDPVTTAPSTTPTTTTPTTTTPTTPSDEPATFTLPEGTKLQRGESVGDSDLTASTDPELIAELQRALAAAGFAPGSPDGIFGESTERAVVAFQLANGLPVDGIVGPETAEALNSAIAGG